jgi:hypothetical protein
MKEAAGRVTAAKHPMTNYQGLPVNALVIGHWDFVGHRGLGFGVSAPCESGEFLDLGARVPPNPFLTKEGMNAKHEA